MSSVLASSQTEGAAAKPAGSAHVLNFDMAAADRVEAIAVKRPLFVKQTLATIEANRVTVLSLDVFDTLVWRLVEKPVDVFNHVGQRLLAAGLLPRGMKPRRYQELRRTAEFRTRERTRRNAGTFEITLEEIYAALATVITDTTAALQIELETERDLVRFDPLISEVARGAASRGVQLLLCSDTYLSSDQVRFITRADEVPWLAQAWIATSSEHRLGKADGLVARLLYEKKLGKERVLHIGDNQHADVLGMDAIGIRNIHYRHLADTFSEEYAVEQDLMDMSRAAAVSPDAESARPVHSISAVRKVVDADLRLPGDEPPPAYVSGLMSLGPLLTGFVEWVVEQAQAQAAPCVFCMTREGIFLAELINRYAQAKQIPLHARPLLVSRSVLFPGIFQAGSRQEIEDFLFRRRTPFTLARFVALIDASDIDASAVGVDLHLPLRRGQPETETVLDWLAATPSVTERLRSFGERGRRKVWKYVSSVFSSAGYVPNEHDPLVVVDLGWSSFSQLLLERAIAQFGTRPQTTGLYLGTISEAVTSEIRGVRALGWLCQGGFPRLVDRLFLSTKEIVEQACSPDLGSVRDYADDGEPILDSLVRPPNQTFALQTIRNVVRKVLDCYLGNWDLWTHGGHNRWSEAAEAMGAVLGRINCRPSKQEAALFLAFAHDENNLSDGVEKLGGCYHRALVEYATPGQIASSPVYWAFGIAAYSRPWILPEFSSRKLGNNVDYCTRQFGGRLEITQHHSSHSIECPVSVSGDGRGVVYVSFFCTAPWQIKWINESSTGFKLKGVALSIWRPETDFRSQAMLGAESALVDGGVLMNGERAVMPGEAINVRADEAKPVRHAEEISALLCFEEF